MAARSQLTEYVHRDFSLVDVTVAEATKGRALAWRAQQLGIEPRRGDGGRRQLQRSRDAGVRRHPVVMANAVDSLKSRGWHVTGHQDEAGVAQAIDRFVLRR